MMMITPDPNCIKKTVDWQVFVTQQMGYYVYVLEEEQHDFEFDKKSIASMIDSSTNHWLSTRRRDENSPLPVCGRIPTVWFDSFHPRYLYGHHITHTKGGFDFE